MVDLAAIRRALGRLDKAEGRVARRNARRAVFGALRSLRYSINVAYPAITVERKTQDRAMVAATKRDHPWRWVEYKLVRPGRVRWDRERAEAFNVWLSARDGHEHKPIRFDLPDRSRLLGQHTSTAIRIKALPRGFRRPDAEKWRTFLHEVAHYRARGHGSAFKTELLRVYRLWRDWTAGRIA